MAQLPHSHFTLLPGCHCGRSPLLEYLLFLVLPRLHTSRGLLGSPGAICDHGSKSLRSKSLGPPALWGSRTRPGPPCPCSSMRLSTQGGWKERLLCPVLLSLECKRSMKAPTNHPGWVGSPPPQCPACSPEPISILCPGVRQEQPNPAVAEFMQPLPSSPHASEDISLSPCLMFPLS